jgi:hypothetical protein
VCKICKDWKSAKIDSRQAFALIKEALKNADDKKIGHLMSLSDTILDKDVPMPERDEYADRIWNESYDDRE